MGYTAAVLGLAVNPWDGKAHVGCVLNLAQLDPTGPRTETNPHECPSDFIADVTHLTFHLTERRYEVALLTPLDLTGASICNAFISIEVKGTR
jgi:hypothetical protein